jgi:Cdc6-like AAA superfamily ATPase
MSEANEQRPEDEPADEDDTGIDAQRRRMDAVMQAFSPAAPVNRKDLFAGRVPQLSKLLDVVSTRGEHGVIYGERGVGKTSLASVGALIAGGTRRLAIRVNCDGSDSYGSIWRKVFMKLRTTYLVPGVGFVAEAKEIVVSAGDNLPEDPSPYDVESMLSLITQAVPVAIFVDEFDRVTSAGVSHLMADTLKTLSDQGVDATLVLVGVADNVGQLVTEHESIERGLAQIPMPRMSHDELREIVRRGLETVDLGIEDDAARRIVSLSQGLPHYTHLLAQEAARSAVTAGRDHIGLTQVIVAMEKAVKRSSQTLVQGYHTATSSPRARTLYPDVLLAAALAQGDELGYFAAADVRDPLRAITHKPYDIPAFSPHLHELTEPVRGAVLQKIGSPRRYRFRFRNPLLQPYVIMRALAEESLRVEVLDQFIRT